MSDRIRQVSEWDSYTRHGRIMVDEVVCYERLAPGLKAVWEKIGLEGDPEMPRAKGDFRSDRRPYQEVLTAQQADRIRTIFAREIDYFGYSF